VYVSGCLCRHGLLLPVLFRTWQYLGSGNLKHTVSHLQRVALPAMLVVPRECSLMVTLQGTLGSSDGAG
jgi:hypothetical protein